MMAAMSRGRPSKRQRSSFGERVFSARQALGLSQAEVAKQLHITQSAYATWERDVVALRPEQIAMLSDILKVSSEELLGKASKPRRGSGPVGRAKRLFDLLSQLPRNQQEKILSVIEPFVLQHIHSKKNR